MSEKITLLPDHVANQIAAGEVIQRPSSIVKELMENAIDAGATNIDLIVKDAGKTLVQVIDNGNGIPHNDLSLAFQRHATSKIKTAEDLFSLKTKGFRGEALASISAISHIYMVSRTSKDSMAKFIKIAGNKIENEDFKVAPLGTSFSVKNLFYNIPARRNFLKSDSVELRHIIDEFNRVAIAHPNINFSFIQNKKEVFDLKKTNLRKRISSIFGSKVSSLLVPIQENTPVAKISGFIIKPSGSRKSRGQQFFFVNNRYIRSPFLNHSVNSAFEGLLSSGYHPGYFIILEVNPNKIDVNIHPTKTEIKFEDEQSLYSILRSTIKHSLGIFQVTPTLDFDRDSSMDTPYSYKEKTPSSPTISVNSSFNPFKEDSNIYSIDSKESKSQIEFESESTQSVIDILDFDFNPKQIKVFQLFKKYLVTALPSGLMIINQNRAHQRVLYEKLLTNLSLEKTPSQSLLFPYKISISPKNLIYFFENKTVLEAMGFEFKLEKDSKVINLTAIPILFDKNQLDHLFDKFFSDEYRFDGFSKADAISKQLCKVLAISNGKSLNIEEQQELLASLFTCKEKNLSPFNRPILVNLDPTEIDKKIN